MFPVYEEFRILPTYWSIFISPMHEGAPACHELIDMKKRPVNQRLGQILITLDVINHQKIIEARQIQMTQNTPMLIGQILVAFGYIDNEDLCRALSLQNDLDMS